MPRTWSRILPLLVLLLVGIIFVRRRDTASEVETGVNDSPHGHAFRQRLVAVGDLHGDIENAKTVLRMAKVIDHKGAWVAGTDILVQTGDIVDRGTYALDIYEMMRRLRSEAYFAGGRVVSVLGNHEMMNALGDWRYVSQADIAHCGGSVKRQELLAKTGWLGAEWLANYSVTARVPLSPFRGAPELSFTHGSLRPTFANLLPYPDAINRLGHSLLDRALTPPLAPPYPPNPYSGFPKGTPLDEQDLYNAGGPLWWRGLADNPDERVVCGWAKQLQDKLKVRRIIGGHTPNFEHIVHRCNASIIIIDTGISYAYGGILSALEIIYTLTPVAGHAPHDLSLPAASADTTAASGVSSDNGHHAGAGGTNTTFAVRAGEAYIEREEVFAVYQKGKQRIALEERRIVM